MNFDFSKTDSLLEDHYLQEKLKQYQILFIVYQNIEYYTSTFIVLPANKEWLSDSLNTPPQNCPSNHQFADNLIRWRLSIFELELTNDDTENVVSIDGQILPCYFADGFCKPTTKSPGAHF